MADKKIRVMVAKPVWMVMIAEPEYCPDVFATQALK